MIRRSGSRKVLELELGGGKNGALADHSMNFTIEEEEPLTKGTKHLDVEEMSDDGGEEEEQNAMEMLKRADRARARGVAGEGGGRRDSVGER